MLRYMKRLKDAHVRLTVPSQGVDPIKTEACFKWTRVVEKAREAVARVASPQGCSVISFATCASQILYFSRTSTDYQAFQDSRRSFFFCPFLRHSCTEMLGQLASTPEVLPKCNII